MFFSYDVTKLDVTATSSSKIGWIVQDFVDLNLHVGFDVFRPPLQRRMDVESRRFHQPFLIGIFCDLWFVIL